MQRAVIGRTRSARTSDATCASSTGASSNTHAP
jgi:hypothetical protein